MTRCVRAAPLSGAGVRGAACRVQGGASAALGLNGGRRRKCAQPGTSGVCSLRRCHSQPLTLLCPECSVSHPFLTWSFADPFVFCLAAFCAYSERVCALFLLASETDLGILCYLRSGLLAHSWLSQTLGWPVTAVAFSVLMKWINCKTLKQLLDNEHLGVSMNPVLSATFGHSALKKNLLFCYTLFLIHSFIHSQLVGLWYTDVFWVVCLVGCGTLC